MDHSLYLALSFILPSQAQKHVTHNEAIRALDVIVQLSVIDMDRAAPPASPSEGHRYIVAEGAEGDWAGQAGRIAARQDGAWVYYAPRPDGFAGTSRCRRCLSITA